MRSELSEALAALSAATTREEIRKWRARVAALEDVETIRREAEERADRNPEVVKTAKELRRARLLLGRASWRRRKSETGELAYQLALRLHQTANRAHSKARRAAVKRELERGYARLRSGG